MIIDPLEVKSIIAETGEFIRALYENPDESHIIQDGREAITVADVEGERQLIKRLTDYLPGSIGFGEEDLNFRRETGQGLPHFDHKDTIWFIDPIDGTRSFKNQRPDFAIMVGLQQKGELTHGWIYFPILDHWLMGEVGGGAFSGGKQVKLRQNLRPEESIICINPYHFPSQSVPDKGAAKMMQDEEAKAIARIEMPFFQRYPSSYSCKQSRWLLEGDIDVLFHANGLVWDNAADTAIYRAAGGVVRLLGGEDYRVATPAQIRNTKRGTLYAPSEHDWRTMREHFAPLHDYFAKRGLV